MNKETGTINYLEKKDSIKNIELMTERYKKNKLTTEEYITLVHENLLKLTNKRDYVKYLTDIGQIND
jgi:hypothetical protein